MHRLFTSSKQILSSVARKIFIIFLHLDLSLRYQVPQRSSKAFETPGILPEANLSTPGALLGVLRDSVSDGWTPTLELRFFVSGGFQQEWHSTSLHIHFTCPVMEPCLDPRWHQGDHCWLPICPSFSQVFKAIVKFPLRGFNPESVLHRCKKKFDFFQCKKKKQLYISSIACLYKLEHTARICFWKFLG